MPSGGMSKVTSLITQGRSSAYPKQTEANEMPAGRCRLVVVVTASRPALALPILSCGGLHRAEGAEHALQRGAHRADRFLCLARGTVDAWGDVPDDDDRSAEGRDGHGDQEQIEDPHHHQRGDKGEDTG